MNRLKKYWKTAIAAAKAWVDDQAMGQAAALSYYALFSIAPLIVIALAVTGSVFDAEASRQQIYSTFEDLIGPSGAQGVQSLVESAAVNQRAGFIATVIGLVTLLVGATTVFGQLQDSLNRIWKVESIPGSGFRQLLRQRVLSFSMVLVIAFLLLVSLLLSAAISGIGKFFSDTLPGGALLWQLSEIGFSFGVTTLLFAALYKILPDVKLRWRNVWSGAFITAIFFTTGKFLIGLYLGKSSVTSAYGVGGSLMVFLVWAYYSSAIVLYGAEFAHARQQLRGVKLAPKRGARWITSAAAVAAHAKPSRIGAPPADGRDRDRKPAPSRRKRGSPSPHLH